MKKKIVLASLMMVAFVGVAALPVFIKPNQSEQVESSSFMEENSGRDYALVNAAKKDFESIDEHQFLEKVLPLLKSYTGKTYTTIVFEDGTGLYFPFSDPNKSAQYAKVDKKGLPTQRLGDIVIKNNKVTFTKAPDTCNKETKKAVKYVPAEYQGDNFALCVSNKTIYVLLSGDSIGAENAMAQSVDFCNKMAANGYDFSKLSKICISYGDVYGFDVNPADMSVTNNDNNIVKVDNKVDK